MEPVLQDAGVGFGKGYQGLLNVWLMVEPVLGESCSLPAVVSLWFSILYQLLLTVWTMALCFGRLRKQQSCLSSFLLPQGGWDKTMNLLQQRSQPCRNWTELSSHSEQLGLRLC